MLAAVISAIMLTCRFISKTSPGGEVEGAQSGGDPSANVIQEWSSMGGMVVPSCTDTLETFSSSKQHSKVSYRCDHGSLMAKPGKHAKEFRLHPAMYDTAFANLHRKFNDPSDMKIDAGHCKDFVATTKKCSKAASEAAQEVLGDSECKDVQNKDCFWKIAGVVDQRVGAVVKELDLDFDEDPLDVIANHFCLLMIEKVQTISAGLEMLPPAMSERIAKQLKEIPTMIAKGAEAIEDKLCSAESREKLAEAKARFSAGKHA
jgi:hypothetical protein